MCDNLSSENSAADENAIIDTNVKLQSSIDRILSMFEETSKQLSTSNSIQNQLAEKLLDSQKEVDELKIQLTNNLSQLEQNLNKVNQQLNDAKNQIESEKIELTNLESVRKDLEAQRTFFTQDLQDSEIKRKLVCELFRFLFLFFEDFSFSWSWHTFGLIEKSVRVFIFDCRCCCFFLNLISN